MANDMQHQIELPLRKAIRIAWRNIRVRWWRSLLVTSGIILALAFLTYVLSADAINRSVASGASTQLRHSLEKEGVRLVADDHDTRTQTRWMVGLALLVSFVGILNAMLMSVTERFAEIGTMKCLGALDSFIIKLFLLESVFQGISGTMIGLMAGLVLAVVESLVAYGLSAGALVPLGEIARILGVCLLAGTGLTIAGALYPAWRAAKMQPVDAMRTEV